MNKERSAVYFLGKNPPGWKKENMNQTQNSLAKLSQRINDNGHFCQEEINLAVKEAQNTQWKELTGVDSKDSHLSIIIPIHNEKNFLESTLGTLATTNIPSEADVVVTLVTNGCTDNGESERIVRNFMNSFGNIQELDEPKEFLPNQFSDPYIDQEYAVTRAESIRFIHINTPTPGKTNALTIGNEIANHHKLPISICLDANTFPAPTALGELYKEAYQGIVAKKDGTTVVSGRYKDHTDSEERIMGMTPREILPSYVGSSKIVVIGALMAWDTQWVNDVGIPHVVLDDFALGVNAVVDGKKVKSTPQATTWRYSPPTVEARSKQLERYVWGVHQIANLSEAHAKTIIPSVFFMQGPEVLEEALTEWAGNDSRRTHVLPFVREKWNTIIENGKKQFDTQPISQTWEDIEGTK